MINHCDKLRKAIEIVKSVNNKLDLLTWRHEQASKKAA